MVGRNSARNGQAPSSSGAAQPRSRARSSAAAQVTPRASRTLLSSPDPTSPSRLRAPMNPARKRLSSSSQVAKPTTGRSPGARGSAASNRPARVP